MMVRGSRARMASKLADMAGPTGKLRQFGPAGGAVGLTLFGTALRAVAARDAVASGAHISGDSLSYFLVADTIRNLVAGVPPDWHVNGLFVRGPLYPTVIFLL